MHVFEGVKVGNAVKKLGQGGEESDERLEGDDKGEERLRNLCFNLSGWLQLL